MFSRNYTSSDVPKQRLITKITLEALRAHGGSATNAQMREYAIHKFDMPEELAEVTFDGESQTNVLEFRLRAARTTLRKQGQITNPDKGRWVLLGVGRDEENLQHNVFPASGGLPSERPSALADGGRIMDSKPQAAGIKIARDYDGDLDAFLPEYHYQPGLTRKLDAIDASPFTQETINEIVLWKTNRYARLDVEVLNSVNEVMSLQIGEHRRGGAALVTLLEARGVDLPMASTILRFRNPKVFQIIDQRAYRAIYGQKYRLNTASAVRQKVSVYFDYLDKLVKFCIDFETPFETIDRLLYQFDKQLNGKLKM